MMKTRKSDFGMKSSKSKTILVPVITLLVGVCIGVCINDIPFIYLDTKIDISSIIATLGLIATIFIMPFIIEAKKDNLAGVKAMAVTDLDTLCGYIDTLRVLYKQLLSKNKNLSKLDYAIILSTFKQISSLIATLSNEFRRRNILQNFETEIKANLYQETYEKCTENLSIGKKPDDKGIQEGLIELNNFFNEVKKYRYKLYE